jgi:hypothetical protein
LDEAERALRTAVAGGYASSDCAYFLAQVLSERGRPEEVKQWVKSALDAAGAFAFRKQARALLDQLDKRP